MRLVRNTTENGTGKYALIRLDKLRQHFDWTAREVDIFADIKGVKGLDATDPNINIPLSVIELGLPGADDEFFVIKLKDKYAHAALQAYATAMWVDSDGDADFAYEMITLAERAKNHQNKHKPD